MPKQTPLNWFTASLILAALTLGFLLGHTRPTDATPHSTPHVTPHATPTPHFNPDSEQPRSQLRDNSPTYIIVEESDDNDDTPTSLVLNESKAIQDMRLTNGHAEYIQSLTAIAKDPHASRIMGILAVADNMDDDEARADFYAEMGSQSTDPAVKRAMQIKLIELNIAMDEDRRVRAILNSLLLEEK